IPARAGSKGIPGKNMQLIGEKPMILFTMEAALTSAELDCSIVSTDDNEVIELAIEKGVSVPFTRPDNLSTDSARTTDVLIHALEWYKLHNKQYPKNIVLLQPTSPFRTAYDIDKAVNMFNNSRKNNLISACELMQHPNDCLLQNDNGSYKRVEIGLKCSRHSGRQTFCHTVFIDGAIYISSVDAFLETRDMIGEDPEIMMLQQSHAIDIDTPFDLELARSMYKSGMIE
ncbi:MAG: acylneuraminate cytidylyltransferase family protein, partial [Spirochaetia bacterium]|nr:acylneuraminate cytidylyltransferase family protein [Spirochaetia bacterium]